MRLLNNDQIDQLLEITRKGNAVQGSVLYKLAYDAKTTRDIFTRLIGAHKKRGFFSDYRFNKAVKNIMKEIQELL